MAPPTARSSGADLSGCLRSAVAETARAFGPFWVQLMGPGHGEYLSTQPPIVETPLEMARMLRGIQALNEILEMARTELDEDSYKTVMEFLAQTDTLVIKTHLNRALLAVDGTRLGRSDAEEPEGGSASNQQVGQHGT